MSDYTLNKYKMETEYINQSGKLNPMKYGRAKGTILLQKYLPKITPFIDVKLLENVEQWEQIKGSYDERTSFRPDSLIGDKIVRLEGSDGMLHSIPKMFEEMKQQNPNSALLLLKTKEKQLPRYQSDGGFNVIFNMGQNIIIEFVGKGFDGRELTHGIAIHEKYQIPWERTLFIKDKKDLIKENIVGKFCVSEKHYKAQRKERIGFLIERCHYSEELLEESIPNTFTPMNSEILHQILDDVIFELYKQKNTLLLDGLTSFGVQGNIIDGKIEPWEIFRAERVIEKNIDLEK